MNQLFDFLQNSNVLSLPSICSLIVVGAVVGFINTISGGATAISYALFMAMGMPIGLIIWLWLRMAMILLTKRK